MKLALALLLLAAEPAPAAGLLEPTPLAPYRLAPPPAPLTPTDRTRAELYREELRRRLDTLQTQDALGRLDLPRQREIPAVRGELRRMDDALRR